MQQVKLRLYIPHNYNSSFVSPRAFFVFLSNIPMLLCFCATFDSLYGVYLYFILITIQCNSAQICVGQKEDIRIMNIHEDLISDADTRFQFLNSGPSYGSQQIVKFVVFT